MLLSIVVPLYNEAPNLKQLCQEIIASIGSQNIDFELILVDDGSQDDSFALAAELSENDRRCKVIRLRRNFGQTAAMAAGFDAASGDYIVPMDGDLQNNPADIPRLLAKLEEGYDVVSGWRKSRKDTFITRKLPSILANGLISRMTHVSLHDYGCTLKAYRKEVLDQVRLYGELHRFVPALREDFDFRFHGSSLRSAGNAAAASVIDLRAREPSPSPTRGRRAETPATRCLRVRT